MKALIGHRAVDGAWFAITLSCGNLVYVVPPPPVKHPAAVCSALSVTPITRTDIQLDATASATDGATISSYTYLIKDSTGAVTSSKTVASTATTSSLRMTVPKDGNYSAQVTVATSLGDQTDANCAKSFTVSPEARCLLNNALVESSPDCKACLDDAKVWYKDTTCKPSFELSKKVRNVTQGLVDANNTTARPGDQLEYTLTVKNVGKDQGDYTMTDNAADILQYAELVDIGDGHLATPPTSPDATLVPTTIAWPTFGTMKPGSIIQRTLLIKIKTTIPATPMNVSNRQSYDCRITNTFGNTINVGVDCPPEKVVEQVATQLPHTGPTENIIFSGIVLAVVVYFYARSRQTSQEIRLIRRDFNAGTI